MNEPYEVDLPVYEGPLDLLLALVTKNKIDIHDIPIHVITQQYLDYLRKAEEMDLDLASSFFTMAATLLLIKSRVLLPRPVVETADEPDPREELARSLEEFKRMKEVKARIEELLSEEAPYHRKEPEPVRGGLFEGSISMAKLRAAFQSLYDERPEAEDHVLEADEVTVEEEMGRWQALLSGGRALPFADCFRRRKTRLGLAVSFMALLELIRLGEARVREGAGGLVIEGRNAAGHPADGGAYGSLPLRQGESRIIEGNPESPG